MKKLIFSLLSIVMVVTEFSFREIPTSVTEIGGAVAEITVAAPLPGVLDEFLVSTSTREMRKCIDFNRSPFQSTYSVKNAEPCELPIPKKHIELLALLTMAEAEGECEYGQRLVIDTVLNRVDNPNFPNDIYKVINQKNQFSPMRGNRINSCYVKDEFVQLVHEELVSRTNFDVIFFRTGHYHSYGTPLFQVGAHYFSSYD